MVLATDSQEPSGVGEHMLVLAQALAASHDIAVAFPGGAAGDRLLARAARLGLRVRRFDPDGMAGFVRWLSDSGAALLAAINAGAAQASANRAFIATLLAQVRRKRRLVGTLIPAPWGNGQPWPTVAAVRSTARTLDRRRCSTRDTRPHRRSTAIPALIGVPRPS